MSALFNLAIAATLFGFAWLVWGALRPRPSDTAHAEQAAAAREVDDLELLYSQPAYDPAWNAGPERLWDAVLDQPEEEDQR
ncbi:hypothetical protein [Streptomyces cupreus]|uniref:Uncharacterized protein n=1 Tax=Streptomyces cupreus TaxID=2759956 RepID=A0A7X1J321_9ACTN|nr:hypothetical protein [Streptomyces cupreus]MBC2903196.1 hypothetical protein [Streptomyces cupreus]